MFHIFQTLRSSSQSRDLSASIRASAPACGLFGSTRTKRETMKCLTQRVRLPPCKRYIYTQHEGTHCTLAYNGDWFVRADVVVTVSQDYLDCLLDERNCLGLFGCLNHAQWILNGVPLVYETGLSLAILRDIHRAICAPTVVPLNNGAFEIHIPTSAPALPLKSTDSLLQFYGSSKVLYNSKPTRKALELHLLPEIAQICTQYAYAPAEPLSMRVNAKWGFAARTFPNNSAILLTPTMNMPLQARLCRRPGSTPGCRIALPNNVSITQVVAVVFDETLGRHENPRDHPNPLLKSFKIVIPALHVRIPVNGRAPQIIDSIETDKRSHGLLIPTAYRTYSSTYGAVFQRAFPLTRGAAPDHILIERGVGSNVHACLMWSKSALISNHSFMVRVIVYGLSTVVVRGKTATLS